VAKSCRTVWRCHAEFVVISNGRQDLRQQQQQQQRVQLGVAARGRQDDADSRRYHRANQYRCAAVLLCTLAVLDPRVGHTMDVLSPFISVLTYSFTGSPVHVKIGYAVPEICSRTNRQTRSSQCCSVLFFSRPRSEGWPHHGRTFSIYLCPLSFCMTLPWRVMSTS